MPHRARAAINVAIESAIEQMMHALEGIKAEHGLTDREVTERLVLQGYPLVADWWHEWRLRQQPLTEQIPIVNGENNEHISQ